MFVFREDRGASGELMSLYRHGSICLDNLSSEQRVRFPLSLPFVLLHWVSGEMVGRGNYVQDQKRTSDQTKALKKASDLA